jgi:transcription initiation factor IIE alpha subunit
VITKKQEKELRKLLKFASKRARRIVEHILKHGQVTTDELRELYGYQHPPRAARDVREMGIPLKSQRIKNAQGQK